MGMKKYEYVRKPKGPMDSAKYHSRSAEFKAAEEKQLDNKATPAKK